MASENAGLVLLYRDPNISCSIPIPLRPRPKPPVLSSSTDSAENFATCLVTNVYDGLEGVEPGTIRYLRIASRLPWPYDNQYGGHRYEPDVKSVMINWTPARVIGHDSAVKLTRDDWLRLVTWIDLNGLYHAEFINKRAERPVYNLATDAQLKHQLVAVHQRRCASCHEPEEISRADWIDVVQPSRSRFLSAPLTKEAGGGGACDEPPYQATSDPDYQEILQAVQSAVQRTWDFPRRDIGTLGRM